MSQNSDSSTSDIEPLIHIVPLSRLQEQENLPVLSVSANTPSPPPEVQRKSRSKISRKTGTGVTSSLPLPLPPSPQLNLQAKRNPTQKRKASVDKDQDLKLTSRSHSHAAIPPTPKKFKSSNKLKSKTGESQGVDIRRFMVKKEVPTERNENNVTNSVPPAQQPPQPIQLPNSDPPVAAPTPPPSAPVAVAVATVEVQIAAEAEPIVDNSEPEPVNNSTPADPEPPIRIAVPLRLPNPSSQEIRRAMSKIEVEYGFSDNDHEGEPLRFEIPINPHPQESEIRIGNPRSIREISPPAPADSDSEMDDLSQKPLIITEQDVPQIGKHDKAVNTEIVGEAVGVKTEDVMVEQGQIIQQASSPSPSGQIDEITSTGLKQRSRTNSCSSVTSRKSTKAEAKGNLKLALEQKNWHNVFEILQANLKMFQQTSEKTLLPQPKDLAVIIQNFIIKSEDRVTKKSSALAVEFMTDFMSCDNIKEMCLMDIILESLENIPMGEDHPSNCYWKVMSKLFDEMRTEAESKLADRVAFPVLEKLYLIVNECHKEYLKTPIKIRLPVIRIIFKGGLKSDALYNGKDFTVENFEKFVEHLFDLESYSEEFNVCLNWANLFISHYCRYNGGAAQFSKMIAAFKRISENKSSDYGISILRKLQQTKAFIHNFVMEIVQTEFPEIQLDKHEKATQVDILVQLSNSKSVIMHDTYEIVNSSLSPLTKRRKSADPSETKGKGTKGAFFLHWGCAAEGTANYKKVPLEKLKAEFARMKIEGKGDINVTDNTKDTPLHDAAFNGRVDVLNLIDEMGLYTKNAEPGPLNVNMLAKNKFSQTILHSAVINQGIESTVKLQFIGKLFQMCEGEDQKIFKLLKARDENELTPIDVAEAYPEVRDFLNANIPMFPDESFILGGQQLLDLSIINLKTNVELQKLLAFWRYSYDTMA